MHWKCPWCILPYTTGFLGYYNTRLVNYVHTVYCWYSLLFFSNLHVIFKNCSYQTNHSSCFDRHHHLCHPLRNQMSCAVSSFSWTGRLFTSCVFLLFECVPIRWRLKCCLFSVERDVENMLVLGFILRSFYSTSGGGVLD
jgi:hypothetical protein